MLRIVGTVSSFHLQPWFPVVLFFNGKYCFQMLADSHREAKDQWRTKGMSIQIHQLCLRQLVLIYMFYTLLEHLCIRKNLKESCLPDQKTPLYFRPFTRFTFIVPWKYKANCFPASSSCSVKLNQLTLSDHAVLNFSNANKCIIYIVHLTKFVIVVI